MTNAEQHEKLHDILRKLCNADVLDCEEIGLLAYHLGIKIHDFYPAPEIIDIERRNTA